MKANNPFGKNGAAGVVEKKRIAVGASSAAHAGWERSTPETVRLPAPVVVTVDAAAYDRDSRRVLLEELTSSTCRFPVNDPRRPGSDPHLFCGMGARKGESYCDHHRARARGAGTRTEQSAHRALTKKSLEAAW